MQTDEVFNDSWPSWLGGTSICCREIKMTRESQQRSDKGTLCHYISFSKSPSSLAGHIVCFALGVRVSHLTRLRFYIEKPDIVNFGPPLLSWQAFLFYESGATNRVRIYRRTCISLAIINHILVMYWWFFRSLIVYHRHCWSVAFCDSIAYYSSAKLFMQSSTIIFWMSKINCWQYYNENHGKDIRILSYYGFIFWIWEYTWK